MFINALVKALLAPPGLILLMLAVAYVVDKRDRALAKKIVLASAATLYLLSMPLFTQWLSIKANPIAPISDAGLQQADAIVVLGSGRDRDEPSWGGDTLNRDGLQRNRYAAMLQKQTGLPLYTSGGKLATEALSEAELMANAIEGEWGAKVAGVETNSTTTRENALFMACEIEEKTIALVTSADHIVRSKYAFEQAGFRVIAAPTGFYRPKSQPGVRQWLPSAEAMRANSRLFVDAIGLLAYKRASWANQCNR